MTARYHVAVLCYDGTTRDVVTRAYGDVKVLVLIERKGMRSLSHSLSLSPSLPPSLPPSLTSSLYFLPCPSLQERVGKTTQGRQVAVVDPTSKLIAIHMNAGLLKVLPLELDSSSPLKAFNIR